MMSKQLPAVSPPVSHRLKMNPKLTNILKSVNGISVHERRLQQSRHVRLKRYSDTQTNRIRSRQPDFPFNFDRLGRHKRILSKLARPERYLYLLDDTNRTTHLARPKRNKTKESKADLRLIN